MSADELSSIITRIADARRQRGLSQAAAARLAGVSQSMWTRAESGDRAPSADTLARMARAVGLRLRVSKP